MASNEKKTYRIAPSFDWPAEDGPVQLGAIIANPLEPHRPLVNDRFELPKVYTAEKDNFAKLFAAQSSIVAGLYFKLLEIVGADLSAQRIRNNAEILRTKKLETRYIIPSDEYIDERMQDERVQQWMVNNRLKAYMITGLKIAYDPSARAVASKKKGGGAAAGASGAAGGLPVDAKAELKYDKHSVDDVSFRGGTDIIFAYELREISYKVVKKQRVLVTKDYGKGVKMDIDGGKGGKDGELIDVAQALNLLPDRVEPTAQVASVTDDEEAPWTFVLPALSGE